MKTSLAKNLVIFPYNTSAKQTSSKPYTVLRKFSKNIFKRFHQKVSLHTSKVDPLTINFDKLLQKRTYGFTEVSKNHEDVCS